MKNWKALCLVVSLATFALTGCDKGQKAPQAPEAESPAQVTTGEEVEKALVDGCEGSGDFMAPFTSGDFKTANGRASCAFNDSVKANPEKPDTKAALIAFLSRFALAFESPELEFLLLQKVPANTLFGPSGNPSSLDPILDGLTGNLDGWPMILHYLKKQMDAGHTPNDVIGKAFEFIDRNFGDWHVLAKAMSRDPGFLEAEIPGVFLARPAETFKANFSDASAADFYITLGRAVAKVFSHYDMGVSSAAGLADVNALAADLNADAKFLSLKADGDASNAAPYLDSLFTAMIQAAANFKVKPGIIAGSGDSYPKQLDDALIASQLKESLKGRMVWMAASDYSFAIDLKKMLRDLPDAKTISLPAVKVVGGNSIELNEDFLKQFISGFSIIKE